MQTSNYDVIVIGGGPSGCSCAIYLKRYGYNPCVIMKDNGALMKAHMIENYYGIKSISGEKLAKEGVEACKSLGIDIIEDEVLEITYPTKVICKNNEVTGKAIFLGLGSSRNTLAIASKFEGAGVSYCATCDGFFYRKKKVAIIGSSDYMLHELDVLSKMIPNITVFTNGEDLKEEVSYPVVKEKIVSFEGENHLQVIKTTDASYEIDGAFVAMGSAGAVSFAKHLGLELNGNYLKVDENLMTNIPGIFAGGDCIGGLLQVSKAVSDGAIAATSISKFLKNNN